MNKSIVTETFMTLCELILIEELVQFFGIDQQLLLVVMFTFKVKRISSRWCYGRASR